MAERRRGPRGRWRRRLGARLGSVRVRATIGATAVAGIALVVGAVALVALIRDTLADQARAVATLQAGEVVAALQAGQDPTSAVADAGSPAVDDDEQLIQIVSDDGIVVASSANVAGLPPLAPLRPGESAEIDSVVGDDTLIAVAAGADPGTGGPLTVLVAREIEGVSSSTEVLTQSLGLGLPVLIGLIGLITWRVVGRALAPVEAMRAEVEEVSAAALHRRLPAPPGEDEIARLAETMNRMLDRLEQAQNRQRQFVSDASHELRSPVATIRQHAEVALAHPERASLTDLAGTVLAESLRVQQLVEDLLLLARVDEHTLRLHRQPVDLDDLVFDEARRLRAASGRQVDTSAVSSGRVQGDQASLRRVVRNLGDNAARHARGRVAFRLAERDGTVTLSVEDDGPGIPETDRRRVLERFVRLDDARTRDAGGAGLGLSIVDEVVAAHGGSLVISSSPWGGARVQVHLPGGPERSAQIQ